MKLMKKIIFTLLPAVIFCLLIEGGAQIYWNYIENKASIKSKGEIELKNDAINYIKESHSVLGWQLKPNYKSTYRVTNSAGFANQEEFNKSKPKNSLRIMTVGESTTHGQQTGISHSYPFHLKKILEKHHDLFPGGIEVINAGVAGWLSDQWMLASRLRFADYKPDIVIFYCGWNDFQSYDPYGSPPEKSLFEAIYNPLALTLSYSGKIKSLVLASALVDKIRNNYSGTRKGKTELLKLNDLKLTDPKLTYAFYFKNLSQTIEIFRKKNPDVKIIVSTIVGRWPMDTDEQFNDKRIGHTWWMPCHHLSKYEAADRLKTFNTLIRDFAQEQKVHFVDMEKEFEGKDRQTLFFDFCHLHNEGYKIIAQNFSNYIERSFF